MRVQMVGQKRVHPIRANNDRRPFSDIFHDVRAASGKFGRLQTDAGGAWAGWPLGTNEPRPGPDAVRQTDTQLRGMLMRPDSSTPLPRMPFHSARCVRKILRARICFRVQMNMRSQRNLPNHLGGVELCISHAPRRCRPFMKPKTIQPPHTLLGGELGIH